MLLPTQPDHLLSVCGDGRGQNCLAISSPRRTGQALTAPYVSITFNIPVPLCVSYSPEVPNSSPPPAPLSPPPPEMTPTCIWLQVLGGGGSAAPPDTRMAPLLLSSPSQLCGYQQSTGTGLSAFYPGSSDHSSESPRSCLLWTRHSITGPGL